MAAIVFKTHKGDTGKAFTFVLKKNGQPLDMTGRTAKVRLRFPGNASLKVDAAATFASPSNGQGSLTPLSAHIDKQGTLVGFVVVDPDLASQVHVPTQFEVIWEIGPAA